MLVNTNEQEQTVELTLTENFAQHVAYDPFTETTVPATLTESADGIWNAKITLQPLQTLILIREKEI